MSVKRVSVILAGQATRLLSENALRRPQLSKFASRLRHSFLLSVLRQIQIYYAVITFFKLVIFYLDSSLSLTLNGIFELFQLLHLGQLLVKLLDEFLLHLVSHGGGLEFMAAHVVNHR
jgi:hypothetical protein